MELTDEQLKAIEPVLEKMRLALRRHGRHTLDAVPAGKRPGLALVDVAEQQAHACNELVQELFRMGRELGDVLGIETPVADAMAEFNEVVQTAIDALEPR